MGSICGDSATLMPEVQTAFRDRAYMVDDGSSGGELDFFRCNAEIEVYLREV